jgi:hypothetical protein
MDLSEVFGIHAALDTHDGLAGDQSDRRVMKAD